MITIEQCRAARGLLGWTQQDLADASGLSKTAINNFEKGHSDIKNESLRAIRMAFESAEIEFLGEEGLRKRTENVQILRGSSAFSALLDDICETLKTYGGEVLINNADEQLLGQTAPKKILEYLDRLKSFNISERILCAEGTSSVLSPLDYCRWVPREIADATPAIFIYGSKVAFGLWDGSMFVIINSSEASNAERQRFEHIWVSARVPPSRSDNLARQKTGGAS